MKRGIESRIGRVEGAIRSMGGCRECRARGGFCFLFGDEPLPDPCPRCGNRPRVTRFVLVDTDAFKESARPR